MSLSIQQANEIIAKIKARDTAIDRQQKIPTNRGFLSGALEKT